LLVADERQDSHETGAHDGEARSGSELVTDRGFVKLLVIRSNEKSQSVVLKEWERIAQISTIMTLVVAGCF
jgi:hypothetical protein